MSVNGSESPLELIREKLIRALQPVHLEIVDQSHLHAGHESARAGGGHYAVTIVAAAFEGLGPPQRHRLVYRALAEQMKGEIHALALRTIAPSEWPSDANGSSGTSLPTDRRA